MKIVEDTVHSAQADFDPCKLFNPTYILRSKAQRLKVSFETLFRKKDPSK